MSFASCGVTWIVNDSPAATRTRRVQRARTSHSRPARGRHSLSSVMRVFCSFFSVRCLPLDIPDSIEVSVAGLELGGSIQGKDLKIPKGVELLFGAEAKVAVVVAAKEEAAPAPAEGAAAPAAETKA